VPSKALAILAAISLTIQLLGCASSPPQSGAKVPAAAAKPEEKEPTPSAAQDAKGFAEDVQRGDAAWQAQDLDRAVYYYVQAMGKSPHDAPTLAKMGTIEDSRGRSELAEKAFYWAHEAAPEEPRTAERLARLYLRHGRLDSAAVIYSEVLSRDPSRTRALDGMGEVCLGRADYAESIRYFDRALQAQTPDSAAVFTHRGQARLRLEDLTGAEADFRAALAVEPRVDTWRYLGDVQVLQGKTGAAMASLLNAMDTSQAYNEIGVALLSVKNYQSAKEYFTKAISVSAAWFEEAQRNLALADEQLHDATR
jgi:tetratricopeptide (TPR) repeat protein